MAGLTAMATMPIIMAREPQRVDSPEDRPQAKTSHFLRRPGARRLLLLILVYKAGDAFATGMLRPFLSDASMRISIH